MNRNAPKPILVVVVMAVFFALTWISAASRVSLTNAVSSGKIKTGGTATAVVPARTIARTVSAQSETPARGGTITTDKLDYQPGETVTVRGNHWLPGETVHLKYEKTPSLYPTHEVNVVANDAGLIYSREYTMTEADRGVAFYLTATGLTSGDVATRAFSDAPQGPPNPPIVTNLDQIQNGTPPPTDAQWSNGNINGQNSVYREGDSVPFRYFVTGMGPSQTHSFTIQSEWTKGGLHAYDYFTNFERTEGAAGTAAITASGGPCGTIATDPPEDCADPVFSQNFPNPANALNWDFTSIGGQPADFFPVTFSVDGTPIDLKAYNVASISFGLYSFSGTASDREMNIRVTFTTPVDLPANSSVGFFWGGHLAIGATTDGDNTHWGMGNGSRSITGAPFHMRAIDFDDGGAANQDRSISPTALADCPTCEVTGEAGPVCPGDTNTYTSTITGTCTDATHSWTITGNGEIIGSTTGSSVEVMAGTACGESFTITDTVTCDECPSPGVMCSQTVMVDDETPPTITTCPTGSDLGCNPSTTPDCDTVRALVVATDDCGTPTLECSSSDDLVGCINTRTFTITAVDSCGNRSDPCVVTYTWKVDVTPPVFTGCPTESIDLGCNPETLPTCAGALALVTASDVCDGSVTPTCSEGEVQTDGCLRSQTFTLTATDACGNSSQCLVTYTWKVDTTPPEFTGCPTASIDLGCNPSTLPTCTTALALVTASDNCDGAITPTCSAGEVQVNGCLRSQTFTLTARDACTNSAQCSVTYTWKVDTTDPEFTGCPTESIDLGCNPETLPTCAGALALVTANDNCDGPITPTCSPGEVVSEGCFRSQTFTLTATDACGNDSQCLVTYTWKVDTTPPVITGCPTESIDLGCNPETLPSCAGALALVTANDDCDGPITPTCSAGEVEVDGCFRRQTFTLTARDACTNSAQCSVTYTWKVDTTPPEFTGCPTESIDLGCNPSILPSCAGALALVTANDNCDGAITPTCSAGEVQVNGCFRRQTFTLTARDACTNSAECSVTYTWKVDTTPPEINSCPTGGDLGCNPTTLPTCADVSALVGATDDCPGSLTKNCGYLDSTNGCVVTRTFTVTVTDSCGNTSAPCYVIYTWTVDTTPPTITCPPDKLLTCAECEETGGTLPSITGEATATDNCGGTPTITYEDVVSGTCPKTITRTWTATDGCLNTATCVQRITCTQPSLVTNSSLCTFDFDPETECKEFRLIYTQDPHNMPNSKLTASNPGQFFYNVFFTGTPGETANFTVTIPYPFETQGANPVHAYDGVMTTTSNGETCLIPGNGVPFTASPETFEVDCDDAVAPQVVEISATVPATGSLYVNIHLDYGLKGCGGYAKGGPSGNDAIDAVSLLVEIPDGGTYTFSVTGDVNDSDSVCNINAFKKNPGVAGLSLRNLTENPVPGLSVTLRNSKGQKVGSAVSDLDGFYQITYKHTGKAATYIVTIVTPSGLQLDQSVSLKANGFLQVDFAIP